VSTVDYSGEQLLPQCKAKVKRLSTSESWIGGHYWSWNIRCDRPEWKGSKATAWNILLRNREFPLLDILA